MGFALGDKDDSNYDDLNKAKIPFSRILENKNCLIILDNVWYVDDYIRSYSRWVWAVKL